MYAENILGSEYTAALLLDDGQCFLGHSVGAHGTAKGELCLTTSMLGYQEAITDPSFSGQILMFTAPHVGNTGVNCLDNECSTILLEGVVMRESPTELPSNYRSENSLMHFLRSKGIVAIAGVDTRTITRHLCDNGYCNCIIQTFGSLDEFDIERTRGALSTKMIEPMDKVNCNPYASTQFTIDESLQQCFAAPNGKKVVVLDCGVKTGIVRMLQRFGCDVNVVPYITSYEEIMSMSPDGVLLSNGPGDPVLLYKKIGSVVHSLINSGMPVFGICLGHQLLALALGCKVTKMSKGHRGSNHPVKRLADCTVGITTQNHGYAVEHRTPPGVIVTHVSLFDGSIEGLEVAGQPVFSVQYHPESSPGTHDSYYLFDKFVQLINTVGSV